MKFFPSLLFVISFAIVAVNTDAQSKRTLLMEEFTQASCAPCERTTPALNQTLENNVGDMVQIRYHASTPGIDPMNADNPQDVQTRANYYGIVGIPNVQLDGAKTVGNSSVFELVTQDEIDQRTAVDSPILVTVEHELSADLTKVSTTIVVINEGQTDYPGGTLRAVLTEEEVVWDQPPGSTFLTEFEAVMKSFLMGAAGISTGAIEAGSSREFVISESVIPFTVYDSRTLGVVAFVQDDSTQEIHNAAYSEPNLATGAIADLAITSYNTDNPSICIKEYTPSIEVNNSSDVTVSSITANLFIDGQLEQTVTENQTLVGGASAQIDFSPVSLPDYTSHVHYTLSVAGGDLRTHDNLSSTLAFENLSSELVSGYDIDFEDVATGQIADNLLVSNIPTTVVVINGEEILQDPFGAYAESESSLRVDFTAWNTLIFEPEGTMTFGDKILLPQGAIMTFDYASATFRQSQDRMEVQISTDCGETYQTLWDKSGSELATGPDQLTDFIPEPDQWASELIDLQDFAGQEVIIRYFFTSGWGNMLYLDNIEIDGLVSVEELSETESLLLFPNPASEQITMILELEEAESANYSLLNAVGQVVKHGTLATDKVHHHSISLGKIEAGPYLLKLEIDDRQVLRQLSIVK